MKKTFKSVAFLLCGALLAGSLVGCDKENEGDNTPEKAYSLYLTNADDSNIVLNHDQEDVFYVGITTDAPVESLSVVEKNGETWCDAVVYTVDSIRVTPGQNTSETDKSATFVVSVTGSEKTEPIEFTVVRRGTETEYTISVSGDGIVEGEYGIMYLYPAAENPAPVTITVNTNAARWFLNDMNMVTDEDFNPVEWYTLDKKSGRDGETVTITFTSNTSAEDRSLSLSFVYEENGWDGASVTVMQSAKPATEVVFYDEDYEPINGTEYDVQFGKDDAGYAGSVSFPMEKDGSIDIKVCEAGSSTAIDGDTWLNINSYGEDITLVPTANNTGLARYLDVVITPRGSDVVLFRFKAVQAGE